MFVNDGVYESFLPLFSNSHFDQLSRNQLLRIPPEIGHLSNLRSLKVCFYVNSFYVRGDLPLMRCFFLNTI